MRITNRILLDANFVFFEKFSKKIVDMVSYFFTKMVKMRVVSKKTLEEYYKKHPDSKGSLLAWHEKITSTNWIDFNHLKAGFGAVDFVGNNHYVFNIKGNSHRLVAVIQFTPQRALIRFIGTHAMYDKINDISNI